MDNIAQRYKSFCIKHVLPEEDYLSKVNNFLGFCYEEGKFNHNESIVSQVMQDNLIDMAETVRWIAWACNNKSLAWARTLSRRLQEVSANIACLCEKKEEIEKRAVLYDEYRIARILHLNTNGNDIIRKYQEGYQKEYDINKLEESYKSDRNYYRFKSIIDPNGRVSPKSLIKKYNLHSMNTICEECFGKVEHLPDFFNGGYYDELSLYSHPNSFTRWLIPLNQRDINTILWYTNPEEKLSITKMALILTYFCMKKFSQVINLQDYVEFYKNNILIPSLINQ